MEIKTISTNHGGTSSSCWQGLKKIFDLKMEPRIWSIYLKGLRKEKRELLVPADSWHRNRRGWILAFYSHDLLLFFAYEIFLAEENRFLFWEYHDFRSNKTKRNVVVRQKTTGGTKYCGTRCSPVLENRTKRSCANFMLHTSRLDRRCRANTTRTVALFRISGTQGSRMTWLEKTYVQQFQTVIRMACLLPNKSDNSGIFAGILWWGGGPMKKQKAFLVTCLLFTMLVVGATTVQADSVTIEGIVNGAAQIVTDDGEAYDLDQKTDLGKTVAELVGARVLVTGVVEETERNRTITVDKFLILDEEGRISMR